MNESEFPKDVKPKLKLVLAVAAVILLFAAAKYFHVQELLKEALAGIAVLGMWGPVIFIAIYVLACVLFIPGAILTLGAGFIFGVLKGTIIVSVASTLGAISAFLVGRHLAREWVAKKIAGNEKFKAVDEAVAREG